MARSNVANKVSTTLLRIASSNLLLSSKLFLLSIGLVSVCFRLPCDRYYNLFYLKGVFYGGRRIFVTFEIFLRRNCNIFGSQNFREYLSIFEVVLRIFLLGKNQNWRHCIPLNTIALEGSWSHGGCDTGRSGYLK